MFWYFPTYTPGVNPQKKKKKLADPWSFFALKCTLQNWTLLPFNVLSDMSAT